MSTKIAPSDPASGPWRLHSRVALRPEPFGALAYHYGNRKLNFLRSPDLVNLVRDLGTFANPRKAFDSLEIEPAQWRRYAAALDSLASSQFLEPVPSKDLQTT